MVHRHTPDEHTLALYHFDEGNGEILKDSSRNGHHGQIVGAKWVRVGEAIPVDLLPLVDPRRDGVAGKWSKPHELVGEVDGDDPAFWLQVPYTPPDEYDLNLTVDPGQRGALIVGLVTPHGRFRVAVDRYLDLNIEARHTTFGDVDNPAAEWKGRLLKPGEKNDVRFQVRRNGLRIVCNGQQVADWQSDLGAPEFRDIGLYQTPNARCLVVGSVFDPLHVHAMQLGR